jgi:predicted transcriptional regulator
MVSEQFKELVKEIQENDKEFKMTPRELLDAFGCVKRTSGNLVRIEKFLEENKLKTIPDYTDGWIDGEIILKHKKKAKSKKGNDPIQRIKLLPAANRVPISIPRDAKLSEAITLMMLHNYSQLPVMNSPRNVIGVITWETIGYGITNGSKSDNAKDYLKNEIVILDYEAPILDAVSKIIDNEFALVKKSDNTISGIVTIADISLQFLNVTEPFLLLEQIENHIRQILDGKFLVEELREFCKIGDTDCKIDFIDDLNFGNYVRIIEKPEHWERLNLSIERSHFITHLDKVREIRNDIMHFDPEGITSEQREDLVKMSKFLMELRKFT